MRRTTATTSRGSTHCRTLTVPRSRCFVICSHLTQTRSTATFSSPSSRRGSTGRVTSTRARSRSTTRRVGRTTPRWICEAFMSKWGKVPLLETYRQMAIRQQKAKDWEAVCWWTNRGLELYGDAAAREEAVEDLTKRRNRALVKLEPAPARPAKPRRPSISVDVAVGGDPATPISSPSPQLEVLLCQSCGGSFERLRVRGRKPLLCPPCRSSGSS